MLPIKKVILFKHGVGYFEREGVVHGDAAIDLYFRTTEMNDVLKSLTVLDLTGGLIASISYESTLSLEEQLKDLAIRLPNKNTLTELLSQIQGAQIAVDIGQKTVQGIVIGIETIQRQTQETVVEQIYISLLVEGATLQSFDLLEAKQIKLLDEDLKKDLQHLLNVLMTTKKKDLKKLTVFSKGEGERTINLSYIVAAPLWKTSYRLLLNDKSSLIQGWALVDNTQDEDWENVALSLVAGLPVSFSHDLYSPRYQPRPVVKVKNELAYAPPKLEKAVYDFTAKEGLLLEAFDLPLEEEEIIGSITNDSLISISNLASSKLSAAERSIPIQTRTVEVSDLFHYEIENPVTVLRQQSALVPILQAPFNSKRVVIYNAEVRANNPLSAILFKNTTSLTLESGPMTVFDNGIYVGEAMLNLLKPNEEQLIPFSVELGCLVSIDPQSDKQNVHQVRIMHGILYLYHYELEYKTYLINNNTERPLDFYLEHRFNQQWELIDTPEPVERTEHFYRFRFDVPSNKTKLFTVTECIEHQTTYALANTSRENLQLWLEKKYIDKKTLRALEGIVQLTEQITQIRQEIKVKESHIQAVFKNQERLRHNLQALGNTEDERSLRERYISQLNQEEDNLAQYQADIETLITQKGLAENNLNLQIKGIDYKAKF
ncbi:hypothetical protein THII_3924 [Thioploca ingrica]|uniref:DUF4139 domain-containing protein n=1 Tax=Thioploca ingrica TaxID=40754 RepID=A0A090BW96_9GAMM|nr:hypothetical protein THII_3924 [Thioploca ingrica]